MGEDRFYRHEFRRVLPGTTLGSYDLRIKCVNVIGVIYCNRFAKSPKINVVQRNLS
jgi:hypothetical protein